MITVNPAGVSCSSTANRSPGFISSILFRSGVNVASVWLRGSGGPSGTPVLVMNAKFTYSTPVALRQLALLSLPVL